MLTSFPYSHDPFHLHWYMLLLATGPICNDRYCPSSSYDVCTSATWNRSTFMGIAIHNLSVSNGPDEVATSLDLSAAVRQSAGGLLGTTVQLSDLVSKSL